MSGGDYRLSFGEVMAVIVKGWAVCMRVKFGNSRRLPVTAGLPDCFKCLSGSVDSVESGFVVYSSVFHSSASVIICCCWRQP